MRWLRSNREVQQAFEHREAGRTKHLISDGVSLWSYGWWEIARWVNPRQCVIRRGPSYSRTTAGKHRSGVCFGIDANRETPRQQGEMNL